MLQHITDAIKVGSFVHLEYTDPEFEVKGYPGTVDLTRFYTLLSHHDWYCGFSDDYATEKKGRADMAILMEIAKQSLEHQALLDGFNRHYFSGEPWGTEKAPFPAMPCM